MTGYLSAFTPSISQTSVVERLLVDPRRAELAARIVELVRESARGESKHHTLVIGPRGWGKTHLATVVYNRLRNDSSLRESLIIARLAEEGETVTSFLDLLLHILTAIEAEYGEGLPPDYPSRLRALYEMDAVGADAAATKLLIETAAHRTVLVIVENLDDVFEGLGIQGQHRLRAFIQDHAFWSIVATAPEIFDAVRSQEAPFYGFFRAYHLDRFTVDDATEMLARIAEIRGDRELAARVRAPGGRARVRALDHLAKGTPRVYVLLSDFLTAPTFEEFVGAFLKTLDGLTPYFQERLRELTPQQRKVIEYLCGRGGAATVKEIARHCFLSPSTTSGHLKALRAAGFVTSESVGREAYYELREPLMRLWHEVKTNHGEPIRLLVEFLRLWYTRDELEKKLHAVSSENQLDARYLARALENFELRDGDTAVASCRREIAEADDAGDFERAARAAEELVALRGAARDFELWAIYLSCSGRNAAALEHIEHALTMEPDSKPAWILKGIALRDLERPEEALEALEVSRRLPGTNALGDQIRGAVLGTLGRYEEAVEAFDAAIAAFSAIETAEERSRIWANRGLATRRLGRTTEAIDSYEHAVELNPTEVSMVRALLQLYSNHERWTDALDLSERLILLAEDAWVWLMKGAALESLGRASNALEAYDRALALNPSDEWARACLFRRANTLSLLGEGERSLEELEKVLRLGHDPAEVALGRALAYASLARWDEMFGSIENTFDNAREGASIDLNEIQTIVWRILARASTIEHRRKLAERLVTVFAQRRVLKDLGPAVVASLGLAARATFDANAAEAWAATWRGLADSYRDLELPSRLLTAAVRYRQTGDRRSLLDLAAEEREIVEKILEHGDSDEVLELTLPSGW